MESIYRDPFWEDYADWCNLKFEEADPEGTPGKGFWKPGPHTAYKLVKANIAKVDKYVVGKACKDTTAYRNLKALADDYVEEIHKGFHVEVPDNLSDLFAFCLWIDFANHADGTLENQIYEFVNRFRLARFDRRLRYERFTPQKLSYKEYKEFIDKMTFTDEKVTFCQKT